MKKEADPIKDLKRELADLKKKVTTLEKQLAKADKRGDVTCTSLTVVDALGKPVANISGLGNIACRNASVTSDPHQRGIILDGNNHSVRCRRFAILDRVGNTELIEMSSANGSPLVELRGPGEHTSVRLQSFPGQGGHIEARDSTGRSRVFLAASNSGGVIQVDKRDANRVYLTSNNGNGDGLIFTRDHTGTITAMMPPQKDGTQPKIPTKKEILKASGRKSTK